MTTQKIGHFDRVHGNAVEGWAVDPQDPTAPADIDVLIDDRIVGGIVADLFRDDLKKAGIREGYAGFSYNIPFAYYDGDEHKVDVFIRHSTMPIPNSPMTFKGFPADMPLISERREWAEQKLLIRKSCHLDDLPDSLKDKKKLAIMSTYHSASTFMSYHYALADALSDAGFVVLVVHAGDSPGHELGAMDCGNRFLYVKRNIGYDFGSWAVGLYAVADFLRDIDELILINDSIIGPIFRLEKALEKIRDSGADLVGLTDSYERCYHLQSYFLWFGRRICRSSMLLAFMARYSFSSDKETVILEGELGLTKFFTEEGFEARALFTYEKVAGAWLDRTPELLRAIQSLPLMEPIGINAEVPRSYRTELIEKVEMIVASIVRGEPLNPSHFFWDTLLEDFEHPFLKRELLFINPSNIPTYFRIPSFLAQLSPSIQNNVMEARRRYGGKLVPFAR